jgi:hypothetical protein
MIFGSDNQTEASSIVLDPFLGNCIFAAELDPLYILWLIA